jgi:choline dehydrogenase
VTTSDPSRSDGRDRADYVVVGAGAAGIALACRLTEDPSSRVVLLEAGPAAPSSEAAARAVQNGNQPAVAPGLNWKLQAMIKGAPGASAGRQGSVFVYEGGKVVGGSSAVNATLALRGTPRDFADWSESCGDGWSWPAVLPYYRKLEDDPVGPHELHGRDGPMPIRRERRDELRPLHASFANACREAGYGETADHNDSATTGVGVYPKNVVDSVRISTRIAYLDAARGRPNLTIVPDALVDRIVWRSAYAAEGVEAEVGGERRQFLARRVAICAGALNTPPLLMRSGIGDPGELSLLGIEPRVALSGVGVGLMDHPVVGVWGVPTAEACSLGEPARQVLLRYTSARSSVENDMHLCMMGGLDVAALFPALAATSRASTVAGLLCTYNRSTSRGHVRAVSRDPRTKPAAVINCLNEPSDIPPLCDGVRLAWKMFKHPELTCKFDRLLAWTDSLVDSDAGLAQAVKAFVRPAAHLGCSARMGKSPEDGAVVDPHARIHGVDNVWVVDMSIAPALPTAPPHLTCLMVAEKIAAELRGMD